jgi:type I restriction enzyme S subunit
MNNPKLRFKEFKDDWVHSRLGDIAEKITAGATPSTSKKEYWGGSIRWMNSGELNLKRVFEVENRITDAGLNESSTKLLPPECVLIGLAGQGKTRGTVAINYVPLCTNQSIAAIHPSHEVFYPEFLYQNLNNRYQELRSVSTGDGGRGGLNLHIIKSLPIAIPSLDEQKKIASFIKKIDSRIELLKDKYDALSIYKSGVMQ